MDATPPASARTIEGAAHPDAAAADQPGPSLWGLLYGALWLNLALLALLLSWNRTGLGGAPAMLAWALALGLLAVLGAHLRLLIHDSLTALTLRDRIALGLLILAMPFGALALPRATLLGDGGLWIGAALLFLAVRPDLARLALLASLLGATHAASALPETRPAATLMAAYFVSWLAALGAVHFAFTGEPHGLRGWWPLRRVAANALLAAIPALVAGALAWRFWPAVTRPSPRPTRPGVDPAELRRSLAERMERLDLIELLWHGLFLVMILGLLLVILYYVRKLLLRRKHLVQLDVLPGQVAELELDRGPRSGAPRRLKGRRAQIAELWGLWALARGAQEPRMTGETAREFAARMATGEAPPVPPPVITTLLEAAHYGPKEPTADDVEHIRTAIDADLARRP